ncbi:MAG: hypothetical protein ABIW82_03535 [Dokdonella sp.]
MIVTARLLDHPQAIEARLRDLGLSVRRDGVVMSLPELYSRVLDVPARDDVLVHAQLTASAGNGLQLSLRGYFDAEQWSATLALLESLLDSLHSPLGRNMPVTVRRALRDTREIQFSDDGCTYAVFFPAQEADAESRLVDVTLSRALDTGEWQGWLAEPPLADQLATEAQRKQAVLALCRKRLADAGNALATADLHVLSAIGDAESAMFIVATPAADAMMYCDLAASGHISISLVDAQGRKMML